VEGIQIRLREGHGQDLIPLLGLLPGAMDLLLLLDILVELAHLDVLTTSTTTTLKARLLAILATTRGLLGMAASGPDQDDHAKDGSHDRSRNDA
jgi:hypothetical protein